MKENQGTIPEGQGTIPENPGASDQVEGAMVKSDVEMGPGQEMQLEAYKDNATILIFSEKSQPAILQSLQSAENNIESLAQTAMIIHKKLEASLSGKGEKMTEITMALGAAHLVSELVVLSEAAKLFELSPEERLDAYRMALRMYFESGLKDGSIDPVKLQETVEPLMNEQQREFGNQQMEQHGISKTAPPPDMFSQGGQQPQEQPQGILRRGQ